MHSLNNFRLNRIDFLKLRVVSKVWKEMIDVYHWAENGEKAARLSNRVAICRKVPSERRESTFSISAEKNVYIWHLVSESDDGRNFNLLSDFPAMHCCYAAAAAVQRLEMSFVPNGSPVEVQRDSYQMQWLLDGNSNKLVYIVRYARADRSHKLSKGSFLQGVSAWEIRQIVLNDNLQRIINLITIFWFRTWILG